MSLYVTVGSQSVNGSIMIISGVSLNGVTVTDCDPTKTPSDFTIARSGLGLNIMRRQDVANYWGGGVSIVRVYDTALSAADITTNWNANRGRYGL